MPDLADGEMFEMKGSGAKPYQLKNNGGVYSCTCPAWRNQSTPIERRTCKHLRKLRGDTEEEARLGGVLPQKPVKAAAEGEDAGPPVLLAESWDNTLDLAGWWMSEKLDGVRAYWDGKQFISRQGNLYHAPDWFVEGLPEVVLDGELWVARKAFQRTVGIVKRQDKPDIWKEVRFLVFDAPAAGGAFEERVKFLQDGIGGWNSKFTALHEHQLCRGVDHLREELARVEALGGEGLMLREPGSAYVAGRSSTLLKVKTFHDDEATVIAHEPGKGKHTGRLGALTVKLANGKLFNVGTGFSDKERASPPPIGALITFRYQELSDAGIPRFPSYVGLRSDGAGLAPVTVISESSAVKFSQETPAAGRKSAAKKPAPTVLETATVAQVSPAPPGTAGAPMDRSAKRYFTCTEDGASKFWEIWSEGSDVTTRWGKIGTDGQQKTKPFASPEKAAKEYDKLVEEKTGKGYIENLS